jgi:hypothetical protein
MVNVGSGLTTMAICADVPQVPAAGVNVYKVRPAFVVLIEEGLQVPLIPSFDVGGSAGAVAFWQYESGIVVKVGEMLLTIVMFKEAGVAQLPADDGVNR